MRYVERTSLSHKRLEYANSLFICQFDVVVSQAKSNKCVKMTKTHVRGVPRADMGFCFVLFFFIKYAKFCCPHGVSVTIVQGRYFDQKRYSVIFQISVIRLNILNWALYNQLPTDRSLYVDVLRLWRARGQRLP